MGLNVGPCARALLKEANAKAAPPIRVIACLLFVMGFVFTLCDCSLRESVRVKRLYRKQKPQ